MDFHPGLDPGCGEDNIFWTCQGLLDVVPLLSQEMSDDDALSAPGVVVSVIRQNQDFKLLSLTRPVNGAQFL
jgi:hypothetical protein